MSKKTRVDLHNHTTLCNHATGTVEEYVKRAIELGIDEYGFACHAPMNFDPKYRMKLEERNIYEKWVNEAKEKYKDKIKILLNKLLTNKPKDLYEIFKLIFPNLVFCEFII